MRKSNIYTSHTSLAKKPAMCELQRYSFDSVLKQQLTRDNTLSLIRSCDNEVYKVEKSRKKIFENSESYAVVFYKMIFDSG